jgi:cellulose synthase (UDP-forming)
VIQTDLASLALHFAPFYVAVNAVLAWMSAGRILPILNDVNQILIAFDVARATIAGLLRPHNQKFRVTLKRAVNDGVIVHGRLVSRFGVVLALYALGTLTAALTDLGPRSDDPMLPLAVTWTLINIAILGLAILACVERPRRRKQERFTMSEPVAIELGGEKHLGLATQAGLSGMMVESEFDVPLGVRLRIAMENVDLDDAVIVRNVPGKGFAVTYDVTGPQRDALIRKLFSGRYGVAPEEIGLSRTIRALLHWSRQYALRLVGVRTRRHPAKGHSPTDLPTRETHRPSEAISTMSSRQP